MDEFMDEYNWFHALLPPVTRTLPGPLTGALMTSLKLKRCGWFLLGLGRMFFFFLWLFSFFPSVWFVGIFLFCVCSCCSFGFCVLWFLIFGEGVVNVFDYNRIVLFFFLCPLLVPSRARDSVRWLEKYCEHSSKQIN